MLKRVKSILNLLFVCFVIASCNKEVSQETGQLPGVPYNSTEVCKSCNFYPWCSESSYTYIDSTGLSVDTVNYYYQPLMDTTIDNLVYTSTLTSFGDTVLHNCTNNVTSLLIPGFDNNLTNHTLLKASLSIGATWQDDYPNDPTINSVQYKIISKSSSRKVNGTQFIDVIVVQERNFLDTTFLASSTVYYARGVGEIEKITKSAAGVQLYHRSIQQYDIP